MSAVLQIDTRNKPGKHDLKHQYFEQQGIKTIRTKLYVGDYALVGGTVCVDTKANIQELAANVDQQHERFRNEMIKARDAGYTLVFLVENEDGVTDLSTLTEWVNPRNSINRRKGLRPPISGTRLAKACATMERKYGVRFMFCKPDEAAERVLSLLRKYGGGDAHDEAERGCC